MCHTSPLFVEQKLQKRTLLQEALLIANTQLVVDTLQQDIDSDITVCIVDC